MCASVRRCVAGCVSLSKRVSVCLERGAHVRVGEGIDLFVWVERRVLFGNR